MKLNNPFVEGSVSFQNFNADVLARQDNSLEQLKTELEKLKAKADDFCRYSDHNRIGFDNTAKAVEALIMQKQAAPKFLVEATVEQIEFSGGAIKIVRYVKKGTRRLFYRPEFKGQALSRTMWARKYDALDLGRQFAKNFENENPLLECN